jgi:hypothetical protein
MRLAGTTGIASGLAVIHPQLNLKTMGITELRLGAGVERRVHGFDFNESLAQFAVGHRWCDQQNIE